MRSDLVTNARFVGTHAARLAAIWLVGIVTYALVCVRSVEPLWLAFDIAAIAGCAYLARRTPRDVMWAAAIALVATLASQLVIADRNGIWLDETNYLATLREGRIRIDGVLPFNLRWLEPMLAGPLDVYPVSDATALKAFNFGALVTTGTYLSWLLLRLGVARRIALTAPLLLLSSYLGVYAATNRLVLDPFNYAVYVIIAHALVRHPKHLWWLLLVGAFNSEKVIYWVPVIFVAELLRGGKPLATTLRATLPVAAYLALMFLLTHGARTEDAGPFLEQLYRMTFSPTQVTIHDPIASGTTMQMLWFPFGALSVFALLGLGLGERWLKAVALIMLPVLAQTLIATDTQRMTAYAFIAIFPLALLYLTRAVAEIRFGRALFVTIVSVTAAQYYLVPTVKVLRGHGVVVAKYLLHAMPALAALEILCTLAVVWLYADRKAERPRA